MQVTCTQSEGLKYQFKVAIPSEKLSQEIDARLNEIKDSAQLPGFRPGKVPVAILRKKYGRSILGEVVEKFVNDGASEVIKDRNLKPAVRPKVEISFTEGSDLEFTVDVEVMPDVDVGPLDDLALERPIAEVNEEVISNEVKRIAASRETSEPVDKDTISISGDILVIDFKGSIDGVEFPGGAGENYSLKLGSNTFIPGFEDQLIGAKSGDEKTVQVTFPDNYGSPEIAGKTAEFSVKVNEVRKVVPVSIDDDLAKSFGFDDLTEMRDRIRKDTSDEYANLSRAHMKRGLMDQLSERYDFAVPQSLVDIEFDGIWQRIEQDRAGGGVDPDDVGKTDDELKDEYRNIAERRVRLGLIFAAIGQKNSISITDEDVNRALAEKASFFPGQEQMVIDYYRNNSEAMTSLQAPLFEEKVVDFIASQVKITETSVSLEALMDANNEAMSSVKKHKKTKKKASPKSTAKKKESSAGDDER